MLADEEAAGDVVQREGLRQVVPDVVQDGGHPEKVLVADGLTGGGGVQGGAHPDEQVQKGDGLVDVAAEGTIVFIALQSLKKLNNFRHLLHIQGDAAKGVLGHLGKVGLGGGQLGQGLSADVQHIAGVEAGGNGAVQGVLPDEVQRAPAQGVDLVVDEDIARTGQGQEQLKMIVEMEAAHAPGLVVIELKMEFNIGHRTTSVNRQNGAEEKKTGKRAEVPALFRPFRGGATFFHMLALYHGRRRYANFLLNYK